jgi:hypothetical protein
MYPNEVSEICNVTHPLVIFVFFDGNGVTCTVHVFWEVEKSKMLLIFPKNKETILGKEKTMKKTKKQKK